jgi:hypothetical protein
LVVDKIFFTNTRGAGKVEHCILPNRPKTQPWSMVVGLPEYTLIAGFLKLN